MLSTLYFKHPAQLKSKYDHFHEPGAWTKGPLRHPGPRPPTPRPGGHPCPGRAASTGGSSLLGNGLWAAPSALGLSWLPRGRCLDALHTHPLGLLPVLLPPRPSLCRLLRTRLGGALRAHCPQPGARYPALSARLSPPWTLCSSQLHVLGAASLTRVSLEE